MPIFYLPPPPFIGGRQPHDPGRKVTPPQAPPNPGFGHPTRLRPTEEITIRQAWEPPFPGWIGGQQPYDPGRRVTPPVAPPNPPFGHPARLRPTEEITIGAAWIPGPPQPQQRPPVFTPSGPAAATYIPPPDTWLSTVIQAWQPGPPQPWQLLQKTIQAPPDPPFPGVPAVLNSIIATWPQPAWKPPPLPEVTPPQEPPNPPTIGPAWLPSVLQAWTPAAPYQQGKVGFIPPQADQPQPTADVLINILVSAWNVPWWSPPQPAKLLQPFVAPDNPPPYSTALLQEMAILWQPGPPAPWQGYRYFQIPNAVVDNPPFPGISSQNVIRMAWEPGPPQPVQKPPLQTISGIEPPPVPPEEPPKTGGAPIYWYGSSTAYRIDTDDPIQREIKRKARERLGRIEIGLLENEKAQEVIEARIEHKIVEETRKATVKGRVDTSKVAKKVAADVKDDIRELRRLKRIQELEEEELEAILIFLSVDMNG